MEKIEVTDLAAKVTPYLFIDELHGSVIGTIVGRGVSRETDFPLEEFKGLQGEDAEINDHELENFVKKIIEEHGGTLTLQDAPVFDGQTHFGAMAVIHLSVGPETDHSPLKSPQDLAQHLKQNPNKKAGSI